MFKVCIISCGMIANNAHIPAFKNFPDDYEIVGVCDINEEAARATAERHSVPHFYTDAEKMLSELKPDVVSVCVPNAFHKEYTLMALNADANVLCEKPLAVTKKDAEEMFECAKSNGRVLMACQSMRFTPDRLAAKIELLKNDIGNIYYGEISRVRRRGIPFWGTFHMKEISCGGAFLDIGVHMLDALVWLMGNKKVESVFALTGQNHKREIGSAELSGALTGKIDHIRPFDPDEMNVEDFSNGIITFDGGASVNFKVAWAANLPNASSLSLCGANYGIELPSATVYTGEDEERKLDTLPCPYDSEFSGHFYIADNLRRVLKGESEPIIRPEETINVAHIIELFYKSAELGREVFADDAGR